MAKRNKRPVIATALGVLGMIAGSFQVLTGMFIVFDANRLEDFGEIGLDDTGLIWLGVVMMGLGAFSLFLASSILSGQQWARIWYTVVGALNIVVGLWNVISHSGEARWSALAMTVLWVITLQLLYNDKADAFFED